MFAVPLCPEVADGRALETAVDDEPSTIDDQCADQRPACIREWSRDGFGEDAEVKQDDRYFRQCNDSLVDVLVDVEVLHTKDTCQKGRLRARG